MTATTRTLDILSLTSAEFAAAAADFGARRPAALDDYRSVFRNGAIPRVEWIDVDLPPVVREQREGDTVKFILRHPDDGLETESVIIPMRSRAGRLNHTLCVSSQVGCAMGCRFCETAQMGLLKNLSAPQIVAQWYAARHVYGVPIRNVVFMGMGEPMDNVDAVLQAIRVLSDRNGPGVAPANISVSTVGRTRGIRRYAALASEPGFRKLKLAVSVNAPNDDIRSSIMLLNRAEPMAELMDALLEWSRSGAPILIEYVLIPGVNDDLSHADELCEYLRPLACKVNVIPYNPRRDSPWPAPEESSVEAFVERVIANGVFVKRRRTLGRSVMAACGQLGNPQIRRRRMVDAKLKLTQQAAGRAPTVG